MLYQNVKLWLLKRNVVVYNNLIFFNIISLLGAVLDESTGKVLVVQDRNRVSLL